MNWDTLQYTVHIDTAYPRPWKPTMGLWLMLKRFNHYFRRGW